ncbi:uncharacterized protein LOC131849422 [Achroia grisella]|uniref:uncharacterized protein LOC131849422 n=1 Tax=Achroia grisella TaxID=688607 RepID=UPI0027D2392C|nr:uncharacterized protein LOC131849422 [Achroia grisella]
MTGDFQANQHKKPVNNYKRNRRKKCADVVSFLGIFDWHQDNDSRNNYTRRAKDRAQWRDLGEAYVQRYPRSKVESVTQELAFGRSKLFRGFGVHLHSLPFSKTANCDQQH